MGQVKEHLKSGKLKKIKKGELLLSYSDGSSVILIEKGYVKRYLLSRDGNASIQGIYGPRYIFPLTGVFRRLLGKKIYHSSESYFYEAVTDVEYYSCPTSALIDMIDKNPLIYRDLLIDAGKRLQASTQTLDNQSLKNARQRIAHLLVYLAREFGKKSSKGTKIEIPLRHQDLADILNISRETASRELSKLKGKIVVSGRSQIIIPDISKLEKTYQ